MIKCVTPKGGKKVKQSNKEIELYYNNINGYQCKRASLLKIIQSEQPDIIALCETKREETDKVKNDEIPGYEVKERNLTLGKEGLMIGVKKGTYKRVREVTESESRNIMAVQIEYPDATIRVIIGHAPQETATYDERSDFYNELAEQVERCTLNDEQLIVMGDMNARIENNNGLEAVSSNGKMLKEVIDEYNLKVTNFHEKTEGQWTRIQSRKDGSTCKSTLDYILLENELYEKITSMIIDEDKFFCPYRQRKLKNEMNIVYSDHCAIKLRINLPIGQLVAKTPLQKVWNFTKDGFEMYKEESKKEIHAKGGVDPTKTYESWEKEFEKLLHICFQKKTLKENHVYNPNKKSKNIRAILSKIAKAGKIQRAVTKRYMNMVLEIECKQAASARARRLKKTMEDLSEKDKFSPNGFWRMKKAADKKQKNKDEPSCIKKENGAVVEGELAVMEEYVDEFKHRLRNREPGDEWAEYVVETNQTVRTWLKGKSESSPPFSMKELKATIRRLKKGKSPGSDRYPAELFIYAGEGVLHSILDMFNWFKESCETPDQWDVMKVITIYKGKGCKTMLKYYRGIFLALVVSKIFEGLIKDRISRCLEDIHILQAGSRVNRGAPDNVFLLRACFDHHRHTKQPLYVTAYDYEQAFDSLWVEDCLVSLAKLKVSKEMLKLIYSLNKRALVSVQTPYGVTEEFETDPLVKQGTVLGSVLCSSSTGEYCGENQGIQLGEAKISSLLYVDDIIDLSTTLDDCIQAHENALRFSLRKKLTLSGTKCYNMVLNSNKADKPVQMAIDQTKYVVETEEITYLGDVFNSKGSNDDLIKDRIRRGVKAMVCISSLLAETDLGIHKINVSLLLYQSLFLSTMLFNSQTWSNIRKKDIDDLHKVQSKFLKKVIGVPSSTCNSFIYLELGVLPIEYEIHKRQLVYLQRILQLDEQDPVRKVFNFQYSESLNENKENNWWSGVSKLLVRYSIEKSVDQIKDMTKEAFKKLVNSAVTKVAFDNLVAECNTKKKTMERHYTDLVTQEYLQQLFANHAKLVFKCRGQTVDIKSHLSYKYTDLLCRKCGREDETLDHVINCGHDEVLVFDVENVVENQSNTLRCLKRLETFLDDVSSDGSST